MVQQIESKSQFRSITDLKKFGDAEKDFPETLTDETSHESIPQLVARIASRGQKLNAVLDDSRFVEELTPEEKDGFDMADMPSIIAEDVDNEIFTALEEAHLKAQEAKKEEVDTSKKLDTEVEQTSEV